MEHNKETLDCPSCAYHNAPSQNFCGNCGKQLAAEVSMVKEPESKKVLPDDLMADAPQEVFDDSALALSLDSSPAKIEHDVEILESSSGDGLDYLDEFALASVEMMNYVQLEASLGDAEQAERFKNDCISWIEERVIVANGVVESIRNNVIFLSFPRHGSSEESVLAAIELLRQIQGRGFELNNMPLKIRMGLDIEVLAERRPITSATERSLATPGSIVISERAYLLVERQFTVKPIGPLKVGNRMMTFYQVEKPYKAVLPQDDILLDPEPLYNPESMDAAPPVLPDENNKAENNPEQQEQQQELEPELEPEIPLETLAHPHSEPLPEPISEAPAFGEAQEAIIQGSLISERHSVELPEEPGVSPLPLYSSGDLNNASLEPLAKAEPEQKPEPEAPDPVPEPIELVEEPIETVMPEALPAQPEISEPSSASSVSQVSSQGFSNAFAGAAQGDMPALRPMPSGASSGLMGSLGIDPSLLSAAGIDANSSVDTFIDETQRPDESLRMVSGYAPPLYGATRVDREGTHSYEETVGSIVSDLRGFFESGSKTGQVISLIGPEGIGKTYIANNLILKELIPDPANPKFIWFAGHNYQRIGKEQQVPLYFWYEMLSNFLSIMLEGISQQDLRTHLSQMMNQIYQGEAQEEMISFFCDLMSVNPLEPISAATLARLGNIEDALIAFFQQMSQHMPILMLIEDIHQADVASLDVLVRLLNDGILKNKICLLLTYSSDFYPEGAFARALEKARHKEYVISRLTRDEIIAWMVSGPFAGTQDTLSASQMNNLVMYSHGSTNYLIESVSYLTVTQALLVDQETGKLSANPDMDPNALMLPATIQEMIQHRLRLLDDEQRYVLQVASILGERFSLRILLDICEFEPEKLQKTLEFLMIQQFIVHDYTMAGQFRHSVVWEQAYNSIESKLRIDLHRLVSEYLEELSNQGNSVNPGLIAYHASNGGMANRAFQYWNMLGVYCTQVGSLVGLNMALSKAMSLPSGISPEETAALDARLRENLGVFNIDENPEFSIEVLEPAVAYSESQGDTAKMIEGLGYLASSHEAVGNIHVALELRDKVLQHIPKEQFPQEYATLQVARLEYLYRLGRLQKALDLFHTEIEPIAQTHLVQDPFYYTVYLNARLTLAEILLLKCDPAVFEVVEKTLKESEEQDMTGLSIMLKLVRAQAFLYKGNDDSCERSLQSVKQEIENLEASDFEKAEYKGRFGLLSMMHHCQRGEWKEAGDLAIESMGQAQKGRDHLTWVLINAYAGKVAIGESRYKDAQHILESMATESSDRRFATTAFVCWRFLADVYIGKNEYEAALEVAGKALEIAQKDEVNNTREIYLLTLKKATVHLLMGQAQEAGVLLQAQWPKVKSAGFLPITAKTASAIAALSALMASQTTSEVKQLKYNERAQEFFGIARKQWLEMKNSFEAEKLSAKMQGM